MHVVHAFVFLSMVALTPSASAQSAGEALGSSGALLLESGSGSMTPEPEDVVSTGDETTGFESEWVDLGKTIDAFRIGEKIADLRAVTVDASGRNYGFYFASAGDKSFVVYRNGRRMLRGALTSPFQLDHPVIFRMTASGDLLHAVEPTQLYVNGTLLSSGDYSFASGTESVQDHGGVLTFPEGGSVVEYDIDTGRWRVLYRHLGSIEMVRRSGDVVAYAVRERGGLVRMYRNGRRVSPKTVENHRNFAVSDEGDVYFFTKAARGYALYRNSRSYLTGRGAGAFVDVDPGGVPWHLSYRRVDGKNDVVLRKGRSVANLLPPNVENIELSLLFVDGGYAGRASFHASPTVFHVIRDGEAFDDAFLFDYPYNDLRGLAELNGRIAVRMFDGGEWRMSIDGARLVHERLSRVWFFRVDGRRVTVYATK